MGPDEFAAIAALAVALVALFVTSAQAIQQYFVSGQLIRLCDSVVYNRMPGQGHRIWQWSQFRFRVVYSIPQIKLLPDLWLPAAMHVQSLPSDAVRLPYLSTADSKSKPSALAGEASWVSFVRAVQYSSGESLRYTMIEGDADRCPSDLPVVPIQLSLRDVIVLAIMAGMECTDFSFQAQSISMQGDAGTITSSRHPVLGTLLHFAIKQSFESHGLQTLGGKIHPDWIARMMDILTVAGQRFDSRDRKRFEEDEGTWIKSFNDRTPIQEQMPVPALDKIPSSTIRQRRPSKRSNGINSNKEESVSSRSPLSSKMSTTITRRTQDGDWSFGLASDTRQSSANSKRYDHIKEPHHSPPIEDRRKSITLMSRLRRGFLQIRPHRHHTVLPVSEPKEEGSSIYQAHATTPQQVVGERTWTEIPRQYLAIKDHGEEDEPISNGPQAAKKDQGIKDGPYLLLTDGHAYGGEQGAVPSPLKSPIEIIDLDHTMARGDFMINKWQQTFQRRQRERSRGRVQSGTEHRLVLREKSTSGRRQSSSIRKRTNRELKNLSKHPKLAIKARVPPKSSYHRTNDLETNTGARRDERRCIMPMTGQEISVDGSSSNDDISGAISSASSSPQYADIDVVEHRMKTGYSYDGYYHDRRQRSSSDEENRRIHHIPERAGRRKRVPNDAGSGKAATSQTQKHESHDENAVRRGRRRNSSLVRGQNSPQRLDNADEGSLSDSNQRESDGAGYDEISDDSKRIQPEKQARKLSPSETTLEHQSQLPYMQILDQILSGDVSVSSNLDNVSLSSASEDSQDKKQQQQEIEIYDYDPNSESDQTDDLVTRRDAEGDRLRPKSRAGISISGPDERDDQKVGSRTTSHPQRPQSPLKSILRRPKESFPEDPRPTREGVAPLGRAGDIPVNARFTKIDRQLVNPKALELGNERYEERTDYVIVLRVLTKEEIQSYAMKTQELRDARIRDTRVEEGSTSNGRYHDMSTIKEDMTINQHAIGLDDRNAKKSEKSNRPTYIRVHRKYISFQTLASHNIPWEWDSHDSNYRIIKQWISESDMDELFEHTRNLRKNRQPDKEITSKADESPIPRPKKHLDRIGESDYPMEISGADDETEEDDPYGDDASQGSESSEASFERNRPPSPDWEQVTEDGIQVTETRFYGQTKAEWLNQHKSTATDKESTGSEVDTAASVFLTESSENSIIPPNSPIMKPPKRSKDASIDKTTAPVPDLGTSDNSPEVQLGSKSQHGILPMEPNPARHQVSSTKPRLLSDDQILSYEEEKLFNHSAGILKELKKCTEHCKDVIATLRFCIDVQPDVDGSILEIFEVTNACNASLKSLLMIVDPVSNMKKVAEIIVADLDVLLHGLLASLKTIQNDFDHIDIVPMASDERRVKWEQALSNFELQYACSLLDNLTVAQHFQEEVTSNLKLGLYKSTESVMWKKRLVRTSGYKDLPTTSTKSPIEDMKDHGFMGLGFKRSMFLSPSRYVQSPNRSSTRGSPPRSFHGRTQQRHRNSQHQDSIVTENEDISKDLVFRGGRHKREPSDDDDDLSSSSSTLTGGESDITGEMNWFWISQMDIIPGYFATPWKSTFSIATCTGAISVLIKTIERFTDNTNLRYVSDFPDCKQWLQEGKITSPSYAHGANGGVVVTGIYEPVPFDAFETLLTPIKLLGSLEAQINANNHRSSTTPTVINSITELMNLDSWLSICGRSPEISASPRRLIYTLSHLIRRVMQTFDLEFSSVDRASTSKNGGGRILKTISNSLVVFLKEQGLGKAEQLFALVGLLRTVKVAVCLARGVDTVLLRDVLVNDLQVWLA